MTPPTGYCYAKFAGSGAVKVPDITTVAGLVIPGAVLGPGDIHTVSEGEAWESTNWTPCTYEGIELPESNSPLLITIAADEDVEDDIIADDDEGETVNSESEKGGER